MNSFNKLYLSNALKLFRVGTVKVGRHTRLQKLTFTSLKESKEEKNRPSSPTNNNARIFKDNIVFTETMLCGTEIKDDSTSKNQKII